MSPPNHDNTSSSDKDLITLAEEMFAEERLLVAMRLLKQVSDEKLLTDKHRNMLDVASHCETAITDLIGAPEDAGGGWTKQGEVHGDRDTLIYYKVDDEVRLTCRIETPIEASLLIPLLSVLNEVDLYETWIPSLNYPFKIGIKQSRQLQQVSKTNQILQVSGNVPWPFAVREVIMQALAFDDIDDNGFIGVRMSSLESGDIVPPLEAGTVRVEFEGAMLFRACPADHPTLNNSHNKYNEPLILVSFKMNLDAHMTTFPQRFINFITRTVVGRIWGMLLEVAGDIQNGRRPLHKDVIASKANFYKWMQSRIDIMLNKIKTTHTGSILEDNEFIAYLQG